LQKNSWEIVQEINETSPDKANTIALDAVAKGATVIVFHAKNITAIADLQTLLADIDLEKTGVQFHHASDYVSLMKLFLQYAENKKFDKTKIKGGLNFDPVIYFAKQQKFYYSQEKDMLQWIELLQLTKDLPQFKALNVNGIVLHNAGATIVQETGYALAIAHEYLNYAVNKGINIDDITSKMSMSLSVGSNYFMEIAKLRAVRLLWATIVNEYKPKKETASQLYINSVASSWNKTIYDPYVNMLRTTTEGMAASLGGADTISLKPFDVAYKTEDDFSRRISRNVQAILKEESAFDKVIDPAAGSYYIENLTNSIAEITWKLFQEVEAAGGIIEVIASGKLKNTIEESCQKRNMDIATRKYIVLGTNQYPHTNETMLDKISVVEKEDAPGLKTYRGAMAFEELRLATEKYAQKNGRPKLFLLKVGNLAMRQARAGFATNFFGCAGYEIIDNAGFSTVEEGVKTAMEAKANLIVICSSDEEYATMGVEAVKSVKAQNANTLFVVAGNPTETMEVLNAAGVDGYIHVRTNVLESLTQYNDKLLKK
jgi:methylmalonyl-CoA mutase